jgi:hypothetical protein
MLTRGAPGRAEAMCGRSGGSWTGRAASRTTAMTAMTTSPIPGIQPTTSRLVPACAGCESGRSARSCAAHCEQIPSLKPTRRPRQSVTPIRAGWP